MSESDPLVNFFKPSPELTEAISAEIERLEKAAVKQELGLSEAEDIDMGTGPISRMEMPICQKILSEEFYDELADLAEKELYQFNPLSVAETFLTQIFFGGETVLDPLGSRKNSIVKWNEEFLKWLKEDHRGFYKTGWGEIKLENDQLVLTSDPQSQETETIKPPAVFIRTYPSQNRRP